MFRLHTVVIGVGVLVSCSIARGADVVPDEVKMPGTQPTEVVALDSPDQCNLCHGGYDSAVEPGHNWASGMMSHAARDPLFWATVAIAEQDVDGAGDLCIRCHAPAAWLGGRSTPTDGSGLSPATDADGIGCDFCHRMTNPDGTEHVGAQTPPFLANDEASPPTGYYGAGQYVIWNDTSKLGPYEAMMTPHGALRSRFHRSSDFCGTCHDVSNPLTGDLAPNNGAQLPLAPGTYSGVPGTPLAAKAAFNNFPYQYGVVERTYSEHMASAFPTTPVSAYTSLPPELQAGAIEVAYKAAVAAGAGGNYADGTTRYFTCQTCHLPPVTGRGAFLPSVPVRTDLPLHAIVGGNYWVPDVITYLDARGKLLLGGDLTSAQIDALEDGKEQAKQNLRRAALLQVNGTSVRVVNLTGHKLISGFPEGRRMWVRIAWFDISGSRLREDGAYGTLTVSIDGVPTEVETLLDLAGTNTRIYEAHGAITQEWAAKLVGELGLSPDLQMSFDRVSGQATATLGDVAGQAPGTYHEGFHFVLNNHVVSDNRIPPFGMKRQAATTRNALPMPPEQYGNPGPDGVYNHWDDLELNPPAGATYAAIDLLYQPTSWEYIQFLYLANTGSNPPLGEQAANVLEAWQNTGMARPLVMASAEWGTPPRPCIGDCNNDGTVTVDELLTGISIALGVVELDICPAFDDNGDDRVTVDEIVTAVNHALQGCPSANG